MFKDEKSWEISMTNILLAYSILVPDIGYLQGMNYLSSLLYLAVQDELKTFTMLANLMDVSTIIRKYYNVDHAIITKYTNQLCKLIEETLPQLHEKIEEEGIIIESILFEWIISMFSNIFPLDLSLKLWDEILFHGEFYIIKIGLTIFGIINERIRKDSNVDVMDML